MTMPSRQSSSFYYSDERKLFVCARLDGPDRRIQQLPGTVGSDSGTSPRAVRSTFGDVMVAVTGDQWLGHWMHDGLGWHGHGSFGYQNNRYTGCAVIQSSYGRAGNFEVVASAVAHLTHFWLNNDSGGHQFVEASSFGSPGALYEGVGLIESRWNTLEVVAVKNGTLEYFQQDGPGAPWRGPFVFRPSVPITGRPAFVQGPWGRAGNFEVVVPVNDPAGGLLHLWRNNDPRPGEGRPPFDQPWQESVRFGQGRRYVDVGILPHFSAGGSTNQLEVLAYGDGPRVDYFSRPDGGPHAWQWQGPSQPPEFQMYVRPSPPPPPPPPPVVPMDHLTFIAEIEPTLSPQAVWVDYTRPGGTVSRVTLAWAGSFWQGAVRPATAGNWTYRFGVRIDGRDYVSDPLAEYDWETGNPGLYWSFQQEPSGSGNYRWTPTRVLNQ